MPCLVYYSVVWLVIAFQGGVLDEFRQPNPAAAFNQPGGPSNYGSGGSGSAASDDGFYQGYGQQGSQMNSTANPTPYQTGKYNHFINYPKGKLEVGSQLFIEFSGLFQKLDKWTIEAFTDAVTSY